MGWPWAPCNGDRGSGTPPSPNAGSGIIWSRRGAGRGRRRPNDGFAFRPGSAGGRDRRQRRRQPCIRWLGSTRRARGRRKGRLLRSRLGRMPIGGGGGLLPDTRSGRAGENASVYPARWALSGQIGLHSPVSGPVARDPIVEECPGPHSLARFKFSPTSFRSLAGGAGGKGAGTHVLGSPAEGWCVDSNGRQSNEEPPPDRIRNCAFRRCYFRLSIADVLPEFFPAVGQKSRGFARRALLALVEGQASGGAPGRSGVQALLRVGP